MNSPLISIGPDDTFHAHDILAIDRVENDINVQMRGIQESFNIEFDDEDDVEAAYDKALKDWNAGIHYFPGHTPVTTDNA